VSASLDITHRPGCRAFSLLELVIVVIVLAIIAAIAVPRISRAQKGAADTTLRRDLQVLRNALDLYLAEHDGALPPAQHIGAALFVYSNKAGTMFHSEPSEQFYLGPYLKLPPPPLPVGRRKGAMGLEAEDGLYVGWIYDADTATIRANCDDDEVDASGKRYNEY